MDNAHVMSLASLGSNCAIVHSEMDHNLMATEVELLNIRV